MTIVLLRRPRDRWIAAGATIVVALIWAILIACQSPTSGAGETASACMLATVATSPVRCCTGHLNGPPVQTHGSALLRKVSAHASAPAHPIPVAGDHNSAAGSTAEIQVQQVQPCGASPAAPSRAQLQVWRH